MKIKFHLTFKNRKLREMNLDVLNRCSIRKN